MFSGVIIWNGRKLLSICNNKNANRQIYTKFSGFVISTTFLFVTPLPKRLSRCYMQMS